MMPPKSPETNPIGYGSSAVAVHLVSRRWLSFVSCMRVSGISILLLVFALAGAGCACTHSLERAPTSVEVERPENNGSVNILPCTIIFSDGQKRILNGGDRVVLPVRPGALWVTAFSPDPYRTDSTDSTAWRSSRFTFRVNPGETLRLSVEPKSKDSAYVGGWIIERVANELIGSKS